MPPSRKSFPNSRKTSSKAGRAATLKRIKKLEERVGQKALASFLGVSSRSVRRYKQGTRRPGPEVLVRLRRAERYAKGLRKTKSIKRKSARKEKIIKEHPEVIYFEKRQDFKLSETEHIDLIDIHVEDIPGLIEYLQHEGCDAAFFIVSGFDKRGEEQFYSSEVMDLEDFAESWEAVLAELLARYDFTPTRIDLIGIMHNAPTAQEG